MASVFGRSVSLYFQLHFAFLVLPTKNYEHIYNFVKIINRNSVSFFHLGYNKNSFFDDVIITSALRGDMVM